MIYLARFIVLIVLELVSLILLPVRLGWGVIKGYICFDGAYRDVYFIHFKKGLKWGLKHRWKMNAAFLREGQIGIVCYLAENIELNDLIESETKSNIEMLDPNNYDLRDLH